MNLLLCNTCTEFELNVMTCYIYAVQKIVKDPILSPALYPRPGFFPAAQTATGVFPHSWQAPPAPPTTGIYITCMYTCLLNMLWTILALPQGGAYQYEYVHASDCM